MEREELKQIQIWINWLLKKDKDGKTTKVPVDFTGQNVGTTRNYEKNWCDYETAKVQVDDGTANGIGIILERLSNGLALAGIDIDHKDINDFIVQDILGIMDTYAEASPSGSGIHLLFLVDTSKLPENFKEVYYMKNPHNNVECYVAGLTNRFLTFTENVIVDKPINERTQQLLQFLNTYMHRDINFDGADEVTESNDNLIENNSVPISNLVVLNTIRRISKDDKFDRLFSDGDTSEYNGDASAADMALTTILAYYIGPNPERIDNLMKQSALYRVKWDRTDYKEMTIKKAIQNCNGKFFNWNNEEVQDEVESYTKTIDSLTAKEIMDLKLEPIVPIVENMLYPGCVIVAGAPKVGKSWYCLDLGISVSSGNTFLAFNTNKCDCLYLALEDSITRIKSRLSKVLGYNQKPPDGFHIATSCHSLDDGLLTELQNEITLNPNLKLIEIDTFPKVRGAQVRGETWYASDYKEIAKLKRFADINKVCIVLVLHLRKQKDSDPFNQISGSTGITGAADTMIVLDKLEGANGEVMMSITGRDVEYTETILRFNKNKFKWEIGSNTSFEDYKQQLSYEKNPIVTTIKALLDEHPEGFSMTATELLKAIHSVTGIIPKQNKPQTLSREINENLQFQLWDYDKIYYEASNSNGGSAGRKLYFAKNTNKIIDIEKSDKAN